MFEKLPPICSHWDHVLSICLFTRLFRIVVRSACLKLCVRVNERGKNECISSGFSGEPNWTSRASLRMCVKSVWIFSCALWTKPYLRCLPPLNEFNVNTISIPLCCDIVSRLFFRFSALVELEIAYRTVLATRQGCCPSLVWMQPTPTMHFLRGKKNDKRIRTSRIKPLLRSDL